MEAERPDSQITGAAAQNPSPEKRGGTLGAPTGRSRTPSYGSISQIFSLGGGSSHTPVTSPPGGSPGGGSGTAAALKPAMELEAVAELERASKAAFSAAKAREQLRAAMQASCLLFDEEVEETLQHTLGWVGRAHEALKDREPQCSERAAIVQELFMSELSYLRMLLFLYQAFVLPVLASDAPVPPKIRDDLVALGGLLSSLVQLHRELCSGLSKCVAREAWTRIGKVFVGMAPFLKMYSQYVSFLDKISEICLYFQKSAQLSALLEQIRSTRGPEYGQAEKIHSLLTVPMYRVQFYHDQCQLLLRHTPVSHTDHHLLAGACATLVQINSAISAKVEENGSRAKVLEIARLIVGCDELLITPHRLFVVCVSLKKFVYENEEEDNALCYLFNDILVHGVRLKSEPTSTVSTSGKMSFRGIVRLHRITLRTFPPVECKIVLNDGPIEYTAVCENAHTTQTLAHHIATQVQQQQSVRCFGVPLAVLALRSDMRRMPLPPGAATIIAAKGSEGGVCGVPSVVAKCVDFLQRHALHVEGLFRVAASEERMHGVSEAADTPQFDLVDSEDPHLVASLLKRIIRELPVPLIPFELQPAFLSVAEIPTQQNDREKEIQRQLRDLIAKFPREHIPCFVCVFSLLSAVAATSSINLMSPKNLGIVFAPSMFRSRSDALHTLPLPSQSPPPLLPSSAGLAEVKASAVVIELLIIHFASIFA
eukprot:TRINITY_DN3000_c0_g1_i1.p1 TRINITY_DN3000_c0_g1~~TRINITY_DN3000_c0_g1_i1.p1  ORF type:complete len:724 (-),score=180.51 TRINITY_DN3000_c0_g1_i1:79-2208(-)